MSNDRNAPGEAFRRATEATLRALAERATIDLEFGGRNPVINADKVRLPRPEATASRQTVRGQADAAALRLRHHDTALHERLAPGDPEARKVFDALERTRYLALGSRRFKGLADNLETLLIARCREQGYDNVEERNPTQQADALGLLVREVLTGRPAPDAAAPLLQLWRDTLQPQLSELSRRLHDECSDQSAFARTSRRLLDALGYPQEPLPEPEQQDTQDSTEDSDNDPGDGSDPAGDSADNSPLQPQPEGAQAEEDGDGDSEARQEQLEGASSPDQREGEWEYQPPGSNSFPGERYRAFTTAFDEIVPAEQLLGSSELLRLRRQLDQHTAHLQSAIARLANRLQRRLMAQQAREWLFDLEEGLLDGARLARVVANPLHALSYKQEKDTDFRDTVVTLLIDNSGSMRGRPIIMAAVSTDILVRTLERVGVKVEILGFTTRAWKGGQSREAWLGEGDRKSVV